LGRRSDGIHPGGELDDVVVGNRITGGLGGRGQREQDKQDSTDREQMTGIGGLHGGGRLDSIPYPERISRKQKNKPPPQL
jgi:hypothetical protein